MRYFSAFSGIGAFEYAIKDLGWECVGCSEIDRYAAAVYNYHYPSHHNYGDITQIDIESLPDFDVLVGGSPCQDLSIAGSRAGLSGSRSRLFYNMVDILRIKKPKYFLFENVASMSKKNRDLMSEVIGVEPVMVDAALVSAQSRKRLFWCNWDVKRPEDLGITLQSILEDGITDRTKSYCIETSYYKGGSVQYYLERCRRQLVISGCALRTRDGELGRQKYLEIRGDSKSNALTHSISDYNVANGFVYRKLTPIECERLQCFEDNYTEFGSFGGVVKRISNTQRYKQLGNSFNVDVIKHIVSSLI